MYGHVPQLPHHKQGRKLFRAAPRQGAFNLLLSQGKQVASSSESRGVLSLALTREGGIITVDFADVL